MSVNVYCPLWPHPSLVNMRKHQGAELLYGNIRTLQQEKSIVKEKDFNNLLTYLNT